MRTRALRSGAEAVGQPAVFDELRARLKGFESHIRSWRRLLAAGHAPVQETWNALVDESRTLYVWDDHVANGLLRTADCVRSLFTSHAGLRRSPQDTENAVRARMKRQEWLYQPGKRLNLVMWEAALRSRVFVPEVLAAQLDGLLGVVGMDTVHLGIVPLDAPLRVPAGNGFWVLDDRLVTVEDWHAELWLDDAETITLYRRAWDALAESAVYGPDAQHLIACVRRSIRL